MMDLKALAALQWDRYPLKHCQSDRWCEIGAHAIDLGELYYDGGPTRRACRDCVKQWRAR